MTETVKLRNKPELKITLNNDGFEIIDASEPKNNGIYSFNKIKKVELNKARTNWLISILSHLVEFITGIGGGRKFKNKANLKLEMDNQTLKISLSNADLKKAERVVELLNN